MVVDLSTDLNETHALLLLANAAQGRHSLVPTNHACHHPKYISAQSWATCSTRTAVVLQWLPQYCECYTTGSSSKEQQPCCVKLTCCSLISVDGMAWWQETCKHMRSCMPQMQRASSGGSAPDSPASPCRPCLFATWLCQDHLISNAGNPIETKPTSSLRKRRKEFKDVMLSNCLLSQRLRFTLEI